jgi:hypothetical protein
VIRNNIILESPANGFNSQDHQGVTPNNLEFVHNTIVGGNPCLRLNNWSNKTGLIFANNAVYCGSDNFAISGLSGVVVTGNVIAPPTNAIPSGGYTAGRSATLDFLNPAGRNVYPTADSPLIDAGALPYVTPVDFNRTSRSGQPDVGAYTWTTSQNPGWVVGPGFKNTGNAGSRPMPPTDLQVR